MRVYQRDFRRGSERTAAWIDTQGTIASARIELEAREKNGLWEVEAAFDAPLNDRAPEDVERPGRFSLSRLMKNIV